jgi:NAD(P)-dependent dehydrogenase (short-subunit alcohol dehydrogenase family)
VGGLGGTFAVVTGASRGIGAAAAAALHRDGATVARLARSLAEGTSDRWLDLAVDLADDPSTDRAIERILAHGVPDVVVSCAGAFGLGAIEAQPVAELDRMYRVNLRAGFRIAQAFLPLMRDRGRGRHILIGSVADHRALAGNSVYSITKFGARGLHEVLREEFRGTGVLCSLISPGPVDTALWDPLDPDADPNLPNRRSMLRAEDVAEAVRWIASLRPSVDVELLRLGPAA